MLHPRAGDLDVMDAGVATMASFRETVKYELNLKFRESMRSRYAEAASTGETSRARMSSASSAVVRKGISCWSLRTSSG